MKNQIKDQERKVRRLQKEIEVLSKKISPLQEKRNIAQTKLSKLAIKIVNNKDYCKCT